MFLFQASIFTKSFPLFVFQPGLSFFLFGSFLSFFSSSIFLLLLLDFGEVLRFDFFLLLDLVSLLLGLDFLLQSGDLLFQSVHFNAKSLEIDVDI